MSTAPVVPPKKSWLSRLGHEIGVVLGIVAKDVKPINDIVVPIITTLYPALAGPLAIEENWVDRITATAASAETIKAAAGQATGTGLEKFQQVLADPAVNAAIDTWVINRFPGAEKLGEAEKAGLIQAIINVINKVNPPSVIPGA